MSFSAKFSLFLMVVVFSTTTARPPSCDREEWAITLEYVCRPQDSHHVSEFACFENDDDMGMFDKRRAMYFFSPNDYCRNRRNLESMSKIAEHICCQTVSCVFKCIEKNRPQFRQLFREFPMNLDAILERTPSYIFKDDLLVSKMKSVANGIRSQRYQMDDYSSLVGLASRFTFKMTTLYEHIYRHTYGSDVDVPLMAVPLGLRRALRPSRTPSLGLFEGENSNEKKYDSDEED